MSNLRHLFVEKNQISFVGNDTFMDLLQLNVFYFRENGLKEINSNLFQHTRNLQVLDLSNNKISSIMIQGGTFRNLKMLRVLYLNGNKLISTHACLLAWMLLKHCIWQYLTYTYL